MPNPSEAARRYLAQIGSEGGRRSRRTLTREQAQAMNLAKKKKAQPKQRKPK